jgi:hypothetical protein
VRLPNDLKNRLIIGSGMCGELDLDRCVSGTSVVLQAAKAVLVG